jgi:RIO kinase 1
MVRSSPIGTDIRAYPRLKDAVIDHDIYPILYKQVIRDMRVMYHTCRLVHADLSEFNLLYNDKKVYVIDVSQSVEHDHPRSLEFLRMDIKNVTDFFRKKGVTTLSERAAFDFITADNTAVDRDEMLPVLEGLLQSDEATKTTAEVDERVFRQAYIPQSLFEVVDPERDTDLVQEGGKDDLIYAKFLDVQEKKTQQESPGNEEHEEEAETDESEDDEESGEEPSRPRGKRHENKEAKKERKQKVKEEARERRQHKMPKAEKKRRVKQTAGKRK